MGIQEEAVSTSGYIAFVFGSTVRKLTIIYELPKDLGDPLVVRQTRLTTDIPNRFVLYLILMGALELI